MREADEIVRTERVGRAYPMNGTTVEALRDVSLTVRRGDFLALTGPSGSGKSTLVHLLAGVDLPTAGRVFFRGVPLDRLGEAERARLRLLSVGLVFQRFHLLPMLTAKENVELPMAEAGVGSRERRARAESLLARVGLTDRMGHKPGQLSGGERQRVAIARALANDPALLLADEPTGELDRSTSEEILELFARLNAGGTTVVVATHDLHLAAGAGRRIELVDGRIEP